jgi:plastocyanin
MEKTMRKITFIIGLLALAAITACGGQDSGIPPLPPRPDGVAVSGSEIPLNSTVKGKVSWEGAVPTPKKIQTSADPGCMNPNLVSEELVVSDGGLENVMIYVSSDLAGKKFPARKEVVKLDQQGCHYIPHALTLQKGQTLSISNSDNTAHNVHAWAMINMGFNEAQPRKGDVKEVKFDKEEIHFPIKCDVHNWMNAFVGVFNHPLHTVSGKGGAFELKMPEGTYEITAIHENSAFPPQKQMVTVADGATVDLNFSFKGN